MSDPRPRNDQGQFAPQGAGGIDPNTTSTAYDPQIIEQRKASLIEKIRRMRGSRGVEESVPQRQQMLSAKLRLRELARQTYDPYAVQPAEPGQAGRDFRNAAIGVGALGAGAGVAYAGWRGSQAAQSAQALTDDALKTSAEARKAVRGARVAAVRVNRAGKVMKTQLTTFPTFKKAGVAAAGFAAGLAARAKGIKAPGLPRKAKFTRAKIGVTPSGQQYSVRFGAEFERLKELAAKSDNWI